ncbi:MAG TPA: hypothetical protein VGK77_12620 [Candidatus Binatia bacterium]
MAQRRRRKRSWVKRLLVYLFVPLTVWFIAFVIWFYWYNVRELFVKDKEAKNRTKSSHQLDKGEKMERGSAKRPPEKIFDEERKKLEDIIKRQP